MSYGSGHLTHSSSTTTYVGTNKIMISSAEGFIPTALPDILNATVRSTALFAILQDAESDGLDKVATGQNEFSAGTSRQIDGRYVQAK